METFLIGVFFAVTIVPIYNLYFSIIMRFADYAGRYVLHCHVLEHEDNAMMARFDVVP